MKILKRVVNNKLRMVYYLIVYTVLLVQFPKKHVWPPHQQNLDPPLVTFGVFLRFQIKLIIFEACSN